MQADTLVCRRRRKTILIARVSTTDDGLRTPHARREYNDDDFVRKGEA
jgi:hypothetical protein